MLREPRLDLFPLDGTRDRITVQHPTLPLACLNITSPAPHDCVWKDCPRCCPVVGIDIMGLAIGRFSCNASFQVQNMALSGPSFQHAMSRRVLNTAMQCTQQATRARNHFKLKPRSTPRRHEGQRDQFDSQIRQSRRPPRSSLSKDHRGPHACQTSR